MKFFYLIALTVFAQSAQAAFNWDELEAGHKYHLGTDIAITEDATLNKNDIFVMQESLSDEGYVMFFTFQNTSCTDPKLKTEMVLFNPNPNDTVNDRSIGVTLEENCEVTMYVETKDFYTKSVFEE